MATYAVWSLATLLGVASPAQSESCRLALVLALDVSASVDMTEDRLQRDGLARALLAPEVVRALLSGAPVALYVFEWSGPFHHVTLSPGWQMVESEGDLRRFAAAVAASGRDTARVTRTTAVGSALGYAALAFDKGPRCWARTLDIAGDGGNNQGPEPTIFYEWPQFDGVTVNALVITGADLQEGRPENETDLVAWFETEVLRGPEAFYVLADGYEDYERAMRVKLERELELPVMSGLPAADGKS